MQFDFKEKAKKRQDRNSPIKPLFCIQFENPSKVSWGEFQISMGFVQPPRSAPIFDSPHESLVTRYFLHKKTAGADNCPGCAFYSLFLCLFLCIIVETNACLAAELAGSNHLAQEHVCSVLGITVFCVENVHDRKDNVQTDQIT